jgi:glycine cleavage system regulatory protein
MLDLVVTLIGPDRPGLVEAVAEVVASHGGNWLESRMAHLAGKFAGILRVEAPAERLPEIERALAALTSLGLRVVIEQSETGAAARLHAMEVTLLGLDRPGLVREISRLFAARSINVEELVTDRYSAPMSGEPMFQARARVNVPAAVDVSEVRRGLERLAGDLMVEIHVAEALGATATSAARGGDRSTPPTAP